MILDTTSVIPVSPAANPKVAAKATKQGKKKGNKHTAHINTLRCETIWGTDVKQMTIYDAVSKSQGCLFLRQPKSHH